jgi:hypothetical protein
MEAHLVVLPGDGIGPEVVGAARTVLEAVASRFGHVCYMDEYPIGGYAIDLTGKPLPEESLSLRLLVLLGAGSQVMILLRSARTEPARLAQSPGCWKPATINCIPIWCASPLSQNACRVSIRLCVSDRRCFLANPACAENQARQNQEKESYRYDVLHQVKCAGCPPGIQAGAQAPK